MLSADAVQRANSGHPGMPMGMADIAEVLWNDFLTHNPNNPSWLNRDRFLLSNGHGSMLLYSLLHLSGYDLSINDLKAFRQFGSHTAGHPEFNRAIGIETTTGPLGQGIANAVGMALNEKIFASKYNQIDLNIMDHYTYVFTGDGCLMEGISHEACSLAGTLNLGKLICFYDDNGISIDGEVAGWFAEDVAKRFQAYGWHVIDGIDGHNPEAVSKAIIQAKAEIEKPSMLACKTVIGYGSPNKAGTADTHGAPLGDEELDHVRKQLGWDYAPFDIPSEIKKAWDAKEKGQQAENTWKEAFDKYSKEYPELAQSFNSRFAVSVPDDRFVGLNALVKELQKENKDLKKSFDNSAAKNKKADERITKLTEALMQAKEVLEESNVVNAKLLYKVKVFENDSLNERQKSKIVESLSNAMSVEEAKIIYDTLQSSVGSTKRHPESLSEAVNSKTSAGMILSARKDPRDDSAVSRWRTLAGINK